MERLVLGIWFGVLPRAKEKEEGSDDHVGNRQGLGGAMSKSQVEDVMEDGIGDRLGTIRRGILLGVPG
jgi:hypothetical protein